MNIRQELRILRRAVARGLVSWDEVAQAAECAGDDEGWLDTLVAAGKLDAAAVASLAAEVGDQATTLSQAGGDSPDPAGGDAGGADDTLRLGPGPPSNLRRLADALALDDPAYRFLRRWRRYRIEGFLGAGGMGAVFKAYDPTLGRYVAVKLLHRNDRQQTSSLLREARSQARIEHPDVCRVYEVGEVEGRPYIAMQLVDGRRLDEVADLLRLEDKVRLVRRVALAVDAAHASGLIHRDLKPGNILVQGDNPHQLAPSVVDFGLARDAERSELTLTGTVTGTPAYLSPEQAQARPLDRRTDVYSLGVVLYELLTGRTPFRGSNPARTLIRLVEEEATSPSRLDPAIPRDLDTLVMKCLEKDPARRYASAREMADDLGRWLDGEPIAARRAGLLYRLGKKVRKNRALTAVVAASAAALVALGVVTVEQRLRARETAELAQRFGRQVTQVEADLRHAAFLSQRDPGPYRDRLRAQMAAIGAEMERLGPVAEGPGHYALGRGYLALHRTEEARDHLERAWAAGQRTPEVAAALGRALGLLYERSLTAAAERRGTSDAEVGTLRRPAVAYLEEAVADKSQPEPYLEALIAFYRGRYAEATEHARQAYQEVPWLYEAQQLEAEVWAARGDEAVESGDLVAARHAYGRAETLYGRLLVDVPSDAALHAARCKLRLRALQTELATGELSASALAHAEEPCDRALAIDPELAEALQHKAHLRWRWAWAQIRRGEDPRSVLESAVELSQRAIELAPRSADAHASLAVAHRLIADWQESRGLDPEPALTQAIAAGQAAVDLQPEMPSYQIVLGNIYHQLGKHLGQAGRDPLPALERAVASYQRAAELDPEMQAPPVNLGAVWQLVAEHRLATGDKADEALGRWVEALERASGINPSSAPLHNNLGNAHLTLAEHLIARGDDPEPELERAEASYRHALSLNPGYGMALYNLAYTLRSRAAQRLAQGASPEPDLSTAHRVLEQAMAINPGDADCFAERARQGLLRARWTAARGGDPEAALASARGDLRQALDLNPRSAGAYLSLARLERWCAENPPAAGDPGAALADGLAATREALAVNPADAEALALRGSLELLAAWAADGDRRAGAAAEAARTLDEALRRNPWLEREFGDELREARAAARSAARGAA